MSLPAARDVRILRQAEGGYAKRFAVASSARWPVYLRPGRTRRPRQPMPLEELPVSRDYEPMPGQWYEDLENEEIFKVLSIDPDEELIRIQWTDREIREIDLDTWHEMDLDEADMPEGWVDDEEEDGEEEDEDDWDDDDWDEDDEDEDDEDEDEDEDYDDDYDDR